jgi:hypothetical protein
MSIKKIFGIFGVLILLMVIIIGGSMVSFMGPSLLIDILHFGKKEMTVEEVDKLIQPTAPKKYEYPAPPEEVVNRLIDCSQIYSYEEFPRTNPLCLNLFQTNPEEITQKIAEDQYDRIILYGERTVFDAPTYSPNTKRNYLKDLYDNVKFMDQIALPKMLSVYGLTDVNYSVTKTYPHLFYRISTLEEADSVCRYGDTTEKVRGCARGYSSSIIPITAVGPQLSQALPIVRTSDKARFPYLAHYPADCYANDVFLHETSHLLNDAGQGTTGVYVMDSWFNEQIAGYFEIFGADVVCGEGTVILQNKPEVKDVSKALAQFSSVFPPPSFSHDYPSDNTCRQALLTLWYKYLSQGDLKTNFKNFFVSQREFVPSFSSDEILAKFLLDLNKDPSSRQFLTSHNCH